MLQSIFSGIYDPSIGVTLGTFFITIAVALVLGALMAVVYCFRSQHSRSFVVTLALLPATVSVVIMLVNGNLGAGVAVAGTFSLVRFRSVPGSAKEICAVFLSMATGLACGMGYPGFAALFVLIMSGAMLLLNALQFGGGKNGELRRILRITVPEDLDYGTQFEDVLQEYTTGAVMTSVKTSNLGSLNKLTYNVVLKKAGTEKQLIDALRCRNGNLEVSLSLETMDVKDL
jgi:hypothetical protein